MHEPFLWPRPHRRGFSFVYAVALLASVHRYATDGPCSTHSHGRLNSRPAALIGGAFLGTFCGRPDPPRPYRIDRGGDLALVPARPHRACRPQHLGRRAARERYGDDAMLEASERADQLLDGKARSSSRCRSVTGGGVTLGLFARLPGRLRGRLIKERYSVANRLQTAVPLGRLVQSPKRGPYGSVQSFAVHAPNVGAGLYDSIHSVTFRASKSGW